MAKIENIDIPKIGDIISEIKINILDPIAPDAQGVYHQKIVYVFKIGKKELREFCSIHVSKVPYPNGYYSMDEFKKL